jgi:hypothetical protein
MIELATLFAVDFPRCWSRLGEVGGTGDPLLEDSAILTKDYTIL